MSEVTGNHAGTENPNHMKDPTDLNSQHTADRLECDIQTNPNSGAFHAESDVARADGRSRNDVGAITHEITETRATGVHVARAAGEDGYVDVGENYARASGQGRSMAAIVTPSRGGACAGGISRTGGTVHTEVVLENDNSSWISWPSLSWKSNSTKSQRKETIQDHALPDSAVVGVSTAKVKKTQSGVLVGKAAGSGGEVQMNDRGVRVTGEERCTASVNNGHGSAQASASGRPGGVKPEVVIENTSETWWSFFNIFKKKEDTKE